MNRALLKYVGGFLLCILMNAVVNGLASDVYQIRENPLTHIPLPTYQVYLNSILYSLVFIVLYGAWGLYVLPLLIFHISARYLESYDYSPFIVLSTITWSVCGLAISVVSSSSSVVLAYSFVGAAYGLYYRIWLLDQVGTG